jgi:DNA-directed RNA polymerase subunit K/omega
MPNKKNKSKKEVKLSTRIDDTQTTDITNETEYEEEISISSEPDVDWEEDVDLDIDNGDNTDNNDECIYDKVHNPRVKNNSLLHPDNNTDVEEEDDDNDDTLNTDIYVKKADRCTGNILTKYEVVRLLGERTSQLSSGAKPMLNGVGGLQAKVIAQLELESKMIPLKLVRPLPNGMKEVWSIDELILKDIYILYGFTGGKVDKTHILSRVPNTTSTSDNFY